MKNILKNFWVTLTRFKVASILNIIGLGVAFAVFSIIMMQSYWELSYNKSFKDADKIYLFEMADAPGESVAPWISRQVGEVIAKSSPRIVSYTATWGGSGEMTKMKVLNESDNEMQIKTLSTSPSFVDVFSLELVGGSFEKYSQPNALIISQSAAQKMFGSVDPIGKSVGMQNDTLEVVAIFKDLPVNSSFNDEAYINMGDALMNRPNEWSFHYYYKMVDDQEVSQIYNDIAKGIAEYTLARNNGEMSDDAKFENVVQMVEMTPFDELYFKGFEHLGNYALTAVLIAIAVLTIVIAVINFINFFMALVPIRIRAININKVFGTPTLALRWNIIGETVGIVMIAFCVCLLLIDIAGVTFVADWVDCSLKLSDNLFTVIVIGILALLIGLLTGIYPAYYITKFRPSLVLRGSFGRSKQGQRMRSVLISVQFVISIALIIGAMFVYLQTKYMQSHDMGYNYDRVVTTMVGGKIAGQGQTFLEELKKNPKIEGVSYSDRAVLDIRMGWGRPYNGADINFTCMPVSWDYPQFMGMKLISGRFFTQEDCSKTNGTIIFNEAAVKKYGIKVGDFVGGHADEPAEVVGIVKDFNFKSLKDPVEPIAIYEFGASGWRIPSTANIRIAKDADYAEVSKHIMQTIKKLNPNYPDDLLKVDPFNELIEKLYSREQKLASIISLFSIVAIMISLVGISGLVIFEMQYRRKEIALRKVHGASWESIPVMINKKFIKIIILSALVAIPSAYVGVWIWLQNFAYRTPLYWWVALVAFALVLLITTTIVTVQTVRAATQNPIKSLKSE